MTIEMRGKTILVFHITLVFQQGLLLEGLQWFSEELQKDLDKFE